MAISFDVRGLLRSPAFWLACAAVIFMFFGVDPAHASDAGSGGGGAGLPWEKPLDMLKKSISGPVAFVIALFGIIACGATLIWGGEVSEFARRIVYVVLVVCLLVFANTLLTGAMFSGAMVPDAGLLLDAKAALSPIAKAPAGL